MPGIDVVVEIASGIPDAGIEKCDVDVSVLGEDPIGQRARRRRVRYVGNDSRHVEAFAAQRGHGRLKGLGVDVREHHPASLLRENAPRRCADASRASAARDDGDVTGQIPTCSHSIPSP
jgi:hypothetical protein